MELPLVILLLDFFLFFVQILTRFWLMKTKMKITFKIKVAELRIVRISGERTTCIALPEFAMISNLRSIAEHFHGKSACDCKVPKLKSSGGVISPINVPNFVCFHSSHLSPILTRAYLTARIIHTDEVPVLRCSGARRHAPILAGVCYASEVRGGCSRYGWNSGAKINKGGRVRVKATMTSWNLNSTSSQPGGVRAENINSNKADICRHWEYSGICRYDSKCQFAHGKEELRPPCLSGKNTLEIFKPYNSSSGSSSSSRGRKSCSVNQIIFASVALLVPMPPTSIVSSTHTHEINTKSGSINDIKYTNPALLSSNWSPLDDGIEVLLPLGERQKNPWKEDLEAEIQKALYGTGLTKRLHVFLNICTD